MNAHILSNRPYLHRNRSARARCAVRAALIAALAAAMLAGLGSAESQRPHSVFGSPSDQNSASVAPR
jgi:hypothetical protein